MSYAARFALKRAGVLDHRVMPLEGLWSVPDMGTFTTADKRAWDWTMLIVQPIQVTPDVLAAATRAVAATRPGPALELLRLERNAPGPAAQGLRLTGRHHEVYLGAP